MSKLSIWEIAITKPLELLGAMTLIASLIFIGYEIRLANRIALVETELEMSNSYAATYGS